MSRAERLRASCRYSKTFRKLRLLIDISDLDLVGDTVSDALTEIGLIFLLDDKNNLFKSCFDRIVK